MRLLLVEDKDSFRRLLEKALAETPFEVRAVGDPEEALALLETSPSEILVTDLRLPGFSGLELIRRAKRLHPGLRILLMSAFGEPRDIVDALRAGADDFLPKPFDLDHFLEVLDRLACLAEAPPPDPAEPWIAFAPAMRSLDQALHRAAESPLPALFHGPQGTGRARAARRLHVLGRSQAPFLAVPAATLGPDGPPRELLARLRGGSLLLLDLENLPREAEPHLLASLLQEIPGGSGHPPVRWMATASSPEILSPGIRERLGVLAFALPGMSQRGEEILPLFRAFLEAAARVRGQALPLIPQTAERDLQRRTWPGQLHELRWCAQEAMEATTGAILGPLPLPGASGDCLRLPWPEPGKLDNMLAAAQREVEVRLLRRALAAHAWDPAITARALGLTPRSFGQRLREHRISLEDGEGDSSPSPES